MSKELIRLRDLCMAFDDELVLDHINLYINDSGIPHTAWPQRLWQDHHAAHYRRVYHPYRR